MEAEIILATDNVLMDGTVMRRQKVLALLEETDFCIADLKLLMGVFKRHADPEASREAHGIVTMQGATDRGLRGLT